MVLPNTASSLGSTQRIEPSTKGHRAQVVTSVARHPHRSRKNEHATGATSATSATCEWIRITSPYHWISKFDWAVPAIFCRPFENQTLIIPTSTSDFKPMNHMNGSFLRWGYPESTVDQWTVLALKPVVLRSHLLRNPQTTATTKGLGHWWAQPSTKRRKAIRSDWRITFSCCVGEEKGKWYAGSQQLVQTH